MVRRATSDGSKQQLDSITLTIICHDFRTIKLTFTAMSMTAHQQPATHFTELGDPVAAVGGNYTELLKNQGSLVDTAVCNYIYYSQYCGTV